MDSDNSKSVKVISFSLIQKHLSVNLFYLLIWPFLACMSRCELRSLDAEVKLRLP